MRQTPIRYACTSDLNNYFKKVDLLGGLTLLEQSQLRKNIGIVDINDPTDIMEVSKITYLLLIDLISTGNLIPGKKYKIIDFRTIYQSNVRNSNGKYITWGIEGSENESPVQQIIVTALTGSRLDPRVIIDDDNTTGWHIEYDVEQHTLDDGSKTKGRITYLKDDNNNSAFYDFKNIKFRRTSQDLNNTNLSITNSYIDLYTFSEFNNNILEDSSYYHNTKNNTLKEGCYNNIMLGDTFNNIFEEDCSGNTFIRGIHDCTIGWNSVNNIFNENVCYTKGSVYNKFMEIGNTDFSMSTSKTVNKVNEVTVLTFLDPITYAQQIIIL